VANVTLKDYVLKCHVDYSQRGNGVQFDSLKVEFEEGQDDASLSFVSTGSRKSSGRPASAAANVAIRKANLALSEDEEILEATPRKSLRSRKLASAKKVSHTPVTLSDTEDDESAAGADTTSSSSGKVANSQARFAGMSFTGLILNDIDTKKNQGYEAKLKAACVLPKYFQSAFPFELISRNPGSSARSCRPGYTELVLGQKGAFSSLLSEPLNMSLLNYQVSGVKRWLILYPEEYREYIKTH
jgi:hypothetical protein